MQSGQRVKADIAVDLNSGRWSTFDEDAAIESALSVHFTQFQPQNRF